MTNIAQQHDVVKNSFFHFINTHIPGADLSIVDDIVLSYVISILEEASQDPCFDVEGNLIGPIYYFFRLIYCLFLIVQLVEELNTIATIIVQLSCYLRATFYHSAQVDALSKS